MRPLTIFAFFDGRPGHEKQTRGLLRALDRRTPVTVTEHRPRTAPWPAMAAGAAREILRPAPARARGCDLVLGTGSRVHLPMLAAKRRSGARAVTCMTPNYPLVRFFDLCFVPRHDRTRPAENIFFTVGPPNPLGPGQTRDPRCGLILVGGADPKSHVWDTRAVVEQVRQLLATGGDLEWTVSSSPRTPADTEAELAELAATLPAMTFFKASQTPPGWVEAAYQKNAVAWVTADSISMVYEALSAGCRVGILPVAWKRTGDKFQKSQNYLLARGLVTAYDAWLARPVMAPPAGVLDEAGRCAEEILSRWWPERLA